MIAVTRVTSVVSERIVAQKNTQRSHVLFLFCIPVILSGLVHRIIRCAFKGGVAAYGCLTEAFIYWMQQKQP